MTSIKVELYVYDLSKGVAAVMSPMFIGKRIDGIWHTSIVVYEREYFFGSGGVESCIPGRTLLGAPLRIVPLGETQIPYPVFIDYLNELGKSVFAGSTYSLLTHNCNNFSNELAQFLSAATIPSYILDQPNEVLNTPLGAAIPALINQLERSARPLEEETSTDSNSHSLSNSHSSTATTASGVAATKSTSTAVSNRKKKENSPDLALLDQQIEEARYTSFILEERRKRLRNKLIRKERKLEKKKQKLQQHDTRSSATDSTVTENTTMEDTEVINGGNAPTQLPSEQAMELEAEERREEEERKKARDPPIIFKELLDINVEFDALVGLIDGKLSPDEQTSLEELHKFMMEDEGSWVLGENFLVFIGRLLNDKNLSPEVRIRTLNVLAIAALKDDIILMLHQDRREHILMNFAFDIDRSSVDEQKALAVVIANLFENLSSSEWLLYISEWTYNNQQTSNIRCTTKVAVHSLLSDDAVLQDRGAAIVHNLACKEKLFKNYRIRQMLPKASKAKVFDDVAVELTMALLQFFNSKPNEEQLFRCMKSLAKFVQISRQEVPQLIQMIGPDPKIFKGTSDRIDELIDFISSKCRF